MASEETREFRKIYVRKLGSIEELLIEIRKHTWWIALPIWISIAIGILALGAMFIGACLGR